jgi:hypothetical protein
MKVAIFLNQIVEAISADYPSEIKLPLETSIADSINNFLRPTPYRKIGMIYTEFGDYDYDEDMTESVEFEMEVTCKKLFKELSKELEKILGTATDCTMVLFVR